jgi:signal transduction histidine kinase
MQELAGELAITRLAATHVSLEVLAASGLRELAQVVAFDWGFVARYQAEAVVALAAFPFPLAGIWAGRSWAWDGQAAPFAPRIQDISRGAAFTQASSAFIAESLPPYGLRSELIAPLVSVTGHVAGAVHLYSRRQDSFSGADCFVASRFFYPLGGRLADDPVEEVALHSAEESQPRRSERDGLAQQETETLRRFSLELAHRLNNPLAAVVGFAELLPTLEGDEQRAASAAIESQALRAAGVVRNLLEYSAEPVAATAETFNLASVLMPALAACLERVPSVELEVDLSRTDTPTVHADREQVRRVLDNLLRSASDALGRVPAPKLSVSLRAREGTSTLTLHDNRPGVSDELVAAIFQPFGVSSETDDGDDLSLPSAHVLARANGGSLRAERHPDGGLVLVLELPGSAASFGA